MQSFQQRVEVNPAIMVGKPIIKGTRITVENIVTELSAGYSFEDILKAHPRLAKEDILAALQYAAAVLKNEKIYLAAS